MSPVQDSAIGPVTVHNLGGIDTLETQLYRGVNVLSGENATNRTSLLRAISASLGSTNVSLKGDAEEGWVEFEIEGETYRRGVSRTESGLAFSGNPYLSPEEAHYLELFACLFEQNRAREAVRQRGDLYDIIMAPVDTDAIERQIAELKQERSAKESRKDEIESELDSLPSLRETKSTLEREIDDLRAEIEAKTEKIETTETSVEDSKQQKTTLEEKLATLHSKQSSLSQLQEKCESSKETKRSLEDEVSTKEAELAEISLDDSRLDRLEADIASLYDKISRKESMMSELQNIMQFNQDMIENETMDEDIFAALREGTTAPPDGDTKTDVLLDSESESIVCWTCGSTTQKSNISETIKRLRAVHEDLFGERRQLQTEVEELESDREQLHEKHERRDQLQNRIDQVRNDIERHDRNIDQLTSRIDELSNEIGRLEEEIHQLQESQDTKLIELRQEVSALEYELEQKQSELSEKTDEIERITSIEGEMPDIETQIQDINQQLDELRGHIDRIEQQTVTQFNDRMDDILSVLEYENLERVWIERKEEEMRDGRRTVSKSVFELHVVRTTSEGRAYEDTIDHLSESEREVTGLVFALAGYLVHDVHEKAPFMILDSLEAIDSDRIGRLIDYFSDIVPNILVALLPEDASALEDEYHRVEYSA
ncbi:MULTISPECIES: archaea-specific SMC-related protein [Salinibaculum]|uniref:archaea-specific SMC-related protein n=1 Tax=Salinibaculum TaxID=2732368 RepID=UPI0030CEA154